MIAVLAPPATADPPAAVPAILELMADTHPRLALAMAQALGNADSSTLRATAHHLVEALASDSLLDHDVDVAVTRAQRAQAAFENWTDRRIDALLAEAATTLAGRAEELAIAAVRETGLGNVPDKTLKIRFASLGVYDSLAGHIAQGPLSVDTDRQVIEFASPVGVVFAVAPVTNPVATAIFKMLIALKGRNALILSFHHHAAGVGQLTCGIVREVLKAHGAPADLVQWVPRPSRKITRRFMAHAGVSLVLATGGQSLVDAAYSSGTPAIGVGPGNAPAWICADADLDRRRPRGRGQQGIRQRRDLRRGAQPGGRWPRGRRLRRRVDASGCGNPDAGRSAPVRRGGGRSARPGPCATNSSGSRRTPSPPPSASSGPIRSGCWSCRPVSEVVSEIGLRGPISEA